MRPRGVATPTAAAPGAEPQEILLSSRVSEVGDVVGERIGHHGRPTEGAGRWRSSGAATVTTLPRSYVEQARSPSAWSSRRAGRIRLAPPVSGIPGGLVDRDGNAGGPSAASGGPSPWGGVAPSAGSLHPTAKNKSASVRAFPLIKFHPSLTVALPMRARGDRPSQASVAPARIVCKMHHDAATVELSARSSNPAWIHRPATRTAVCRGRASVSVRARRNR